ncbi:MULTISPECIES: HEPN domain-containing protein [Vibrio]|uniref:HEPN domain-containing protein n=1 Tax=Vibrio TaxID=662 RepID=UPI000D35AD8B|nr:MULTISPECIES: HEPN domain-containing protein [Vibrio]PTQ00325.1 hypothetical protein CWO13_17695 [Vibrio sp. ZF 223]TCV23601.1 hypothetical protein EDB71_1138 [Vibrio crassostreae]CAK1996998.1 RiboL-PSP-HEPN domain-containing protein [Vibrio crassostreae]CAK2917672.1 RiboL-PSP-HEPN domain-containing protein [Vibrio crassostreae]CAK3675312.1 RiboL-PSP-HEPN domain-containing protein [Vibrio crassostreae]
MYMSQARKEFELALSDSEELIACYDSMNHCDSGMSPPEVLKRATLIMTLTAWETYVEDIASELINAKYGMVMGSQVGSIITGRLHDHLKVFNNPDSKKTKDLFQEFFGIDVTESWVWGNFHTAKDSRTALNSWLRKRGEAVHRAQIDKQSSHIVKRDELDKCIRFFRELVEVTDRKLLAI